MIGQTMHIQHPECAVAVACAWRSSEVMAADRRMPHSGQNTSELELLWVGE
jgi:hypothetical protein